MRQLRAWQENQQSRFAWDAYRRFCQMFGDVVLGVEHSKFEEICKRLKTNAA